MPSSVKDTEWDFTDDDLWRRAFDTDLPLKERKSDEELPYGEDAWPAGVAPLLGRDVSFYELDVLGEAVSMEVQSGIETFRRSLALGSGNNTIKLPYVTAQLKSVLRYREQMDSYAAGSDAHTQAEIGELFLLFFVVVSICTSLTRPPCGCPLSQRTSVSCLLRSKCLTCPSFGPVSRTGSGCGASTRRRRPVCSKLSSRRTCRGQTPMRFLSLLHGCSRCLRVYLWPVSRC